MMGVYKITNNITGQSYVGSSTDILKRWGQHIRELNNKSHYNEKLLDSFNEYGITNFKFEIMELVNSYDILSVVEQKYLNELDFEKDYNFMNSRINYRNVKEFIRWINENWAVEYTKKEDNKKIYDKHKDEFVKLAIEYNIFGIERKEISFDMVMNFIETHGYSVSISYSEGKNNIYRTIIINKSKVCKNKKSKSIKRKYKVPT